VSVFIDTNIFVYMRDVRHEAKRKVARDWLLQLQVRNAAMINQQVLRETYRVFTEKLHLQPTVATRQAVLDLLPLATAPDGAELWELAWAMQDRYQTGWWDSLLLSSAIAAGCRWFLTEDRGIPSIISEIVIVDAFSADMGTVLNSI
jgi:predicted nucleic acid-binding protein